MIFAIVETGYPPPSPTPQLTQPEWLANLFSIFSVCSFLVVAKMEALPILASGGLVMENTHIILPYSTGRS